MENTQIIEILDYWNFWHADCEVGVSRPQHADELYRQKDVKEVSVVTGVRRSGKSTILLQVLKKIIERGAPRENTLYINFEEPAFSSHLEIEFLLRIYDTYLETFNPQGKVFIVLDEIQLVPQWEKFVRGLYDRNEKVKFYVTGSSAKLLSKEFGAALTGRTYSHEVFPLGFGEFLEFKEKKSLLSGVKGKGSPALRHMFRQYMEFGGFPQVVLTAQDKDKTHILKEYYSAIIEKDIVQRYEIREIKQLKEFCLNVVVQNANTFSGYQAEKKQGISQPTANKFLEYAKEVFLIQTTDFFSYSFTQQKNKPQKVFVIDPGLYNAVSFKFSENLGKIFESIVYLEYRRKQKDIFYWQGKHEIDFLLRKGTKIERVVNVCWELNKENKEREVAGLLEAMKQFKTKQAEIITTGYDEEIKIGAARILVKNFFSFLTDLTF